ncbi:MAG: replication-associated recombination protein A [Planctomycetes bacterium]|nr:replication-associated recombination protein A [Planctomycetota bacterium]
MSLFAEPPAAESARPLAERMRPKSLDEVIGHDELLGAERSLRRAIEAGQPGSLILWGPPGVGKTTLARLIADAVDGAFEPFSAVLSGVKDVRAAVERARQLRSREGRTTLVFVDEIHRFNKAQQDAFLPHVESGDIVLVGATTENPSFSVISALLSRCRVVRLDVLADESVEELCRRALADRERGIGRLELEFEAEAMRTLVGIAGGDARRALTILDALATTAEPGAAIDRAAIEECAQSRTLAHDRAGDHHFDLLSALHKSLRNSDPQAAVYWLARMLEAGADPMQAARRLVAAAAEDVGLADPMALQIATSALTALHQLGLPEGRLPLAQAVIYVASAPKSNSVTRAIDAAARTVREGRQHPVPPHLRNAPTRLARELGHAEGYRYAHDEPGSVADMDCLPEDMQGVRFYEPGDWGFEQRMRERLGEIERRRDES